MTTMETKPTKKTSSSSPSPASVRLATVKVVGISPFSPSAPFKDRKGDNETADQYESRVWRDRIHRDQDGTAVIPAMMIQLGLQFSAKRRGETVPGKGKATYTKHFLGGILVADHARLEGVHFEAVREQWIFVNADGKRGSGTRVWRCFPMIDPPWRTTFQVNVFDHIIEEDIFAKVAQDFGTYCGVGRFSPRVGGVNGRFQVESITWKNIN